MVNPKKHWLIFLPIFAFAFFLFLPNLNYYFFQDDWFVLNWVRVENFSSFFNFRTDIIYWRPLSMPILFSFAKALFGLNYHAFHLIAFLIFLSLSIVVYNLLLILTKDKKPAIIGSFMYTIWPIHYLSLAWFSTTSYILGPFFQCLTFIFFLKYQESKKSIHKMAIYLFFILGMMSSEFTLVLPAIFLSWSVLVKKKLNLPLLIPLILLESSYLLSRFVIFPVPATGTYTPVFNLQIIYNFIWYVLWALGLPESFKSLIFLTLPQQSLRVITQFWQITIPTAAVSALIGYMFLKNVKAGLNLYLFGVAWLVIGLLPVITVTNHSYPMYLSLGGIGFIYFVLTAFKRAKTLPVIALVILWSIISLTNLQFTRLTHWARNEQAISYAYSNFVQAKEKKPPENSAFLFKPANIKFANVFHFVLVEGEDTLKLSLSDQNAIRVIFNDSSIKSFYEGNNQKVQIPPNTQIFEIAPSL